MNDLFYLTEDQRMIRDLARKVARDRIAPHAAHYDETESYPTESMRALVDSGLFGIWVPEEYGGAGMGLSLPSPAADVVRRGGAWPTTHLRRPPPSGRPRLLASIAVHAKKAPRPP